MIKLTQQAAMLSLEGAVVEKVRRAARQLLLAIQICSVLLKAGAVRVGMNGTLYRIDAYL